MPFGSKLGDRSSVAIDAPLSRWITFSLHSSISRTTSEVRAKASSFNSPTPARAVSLATAPYPAPGPEVFMSDKRKVSIDIDEVIVDRCKHVHDKVRAKFGAGGECSAEEANGLLITLSRIQDAIRCAVNNAELEARMARPEIGETFSAWRFNYGDDPIGTVIADDGVKVTIEVPASVIPARPKQIVPGFTYGAAWDDEHAGWIDWSDKDETDKQ